MNKNNFTAIWVFTPSDGGLDFKVYPEFDILNESNSDSPDGPFKLEKPIDGYGVEVYSHTGEDSTSKGTSDCCLLS